MGDVGDYWNDVREHKKQQRRSWPECPVCAVRYGGNGTKNPPGVPCRNCGWVDPALAPKGLKCPDCGKRMNTEAGLADHIRMKHERTGK